METRFHGCNGFSTPTIEDVTVIFTLVQVSTLGQEADGLVQVSVDQAEPIKHGEISTNCEKLLGKVNDDLSIL